MNLGGKADTASPGHLDLMYAQLKATLTNSAYSPPVATGVQLAVDGKIQVQSKSGGVVAVAAAGPARGSQPGPLYYASGEVVRQLRVQARHRTGTLVQSLAQPSGDITALAASPVGGVPAPPPQVAVALRQGNGCVIRVGSPTTLSAAGKRMISPSGGPCNSLSWDNDESLWAVSPSGIWVLQAGNGPVPVSAPAQLPPGAKVLALRMAPDAVRAAFLVSAGGHTQLYVAAVKFGSKSKGASFGPAVRSVTDLAQTSVMAVSWYNPYFLLAAWRLPAVRGAIDGRTTGERPVGGADNGRAAGRRAVAHRGRARAGRRHRVRGRLYVHGAVLLLGSHPGQRIRAGLPRLTGCPRRPVSSASTGGWRQCRNSTKRRLNRTFRLTLGPGRSRRLVPG